MRDAIWNIPQHVGWQIIHAYEQSNGNPRAYKKTQKSNNTFESFRDIVIPEDKETDTLRI